uniref:Uncharacterized protein n=1 Tax=Ralstonia solanacearum TaxID=305 RepID=A0A0S4TQN8_RALSL|nr:protein of unknown function [Ralstonia solanacearum]
MFRLQLHALQGFVMSLRKLAFANQPVPSYTVGSEQFAENRASHWAHEDGRQARPEPAQGCTRRCDARGAV